MDESLIRKSSVVPESGGSQRWTPLGVRWAGWSSALMLLCFPSLVFAQSPCGGIHVRVLDIKNSTGAVACALFKSSEGFPAEYLRSATNIIFIKIRDRQARCDFEDISPGTYALAVAHDENMNGKIDMNWMKIPREGYGFSNNAKGVIGPPSFSVSSFPYDGEYLELTISMNY